MSRKLSAAVVALVLTVAAFGVSLNRVGRTEALAAPASSATELLNMLPASDAVGFLDMQRMLSEVVPNIFVNDAATMTRVNESIDKLKEKTGADVRQFDAVAVGVRFRKGGSADPEVVTGIIRGRFNASEVIAAGLAKAKAERKVQPQEEDYEGVTIYNIEGTQARGLRLAAIDSNTIAFGDIAGVRATLDTRSGRGSRVDSSLVELATLNASAVAGFAVNVPADMTKSLAKDEMGQMFSSVRQAFGSASANGTTGTLDVTFRTESNEQAQAMSKQFDVLRQLVVFGMRKSEEKNNAVLTAGDDKIAGNTRVSVPFPLHWLKDVGITAEQSDVKLRLEKPLAELAPFVRDFKP